EMTATAIAPIKLDIIAHATEPTVDVGAAAPVIAQQRGIAGAEPVTAADFNSAVKVGGNHPSPTGRLFAVQPSYFQSFDLLQVSDGKFDPHGVMVSEAMAIAQGIKVGDSLQLTFAGVDQPVTLPVTGIVNLDNADALFTIAAESENALVADVVFVDYAWFQQTLQAPLAVQAANLQATPPPGAVVLDPQVHVKIDRSLLP
ncbi:MAG: ABC transporter permease, partial [Caldilineaceae bacterium]|nr:ABC transporter permease [Caldilineaceae bacterium]